MKGKEWLIKKLRREGIDEFEKITLKHFGEMYFHFEERLRDDLKARTHSELFRLREATKKIGKKDWYALYRIRKSLTEILDEVMKRKGIK